MCTNAVHLSTHCTRAHCWLSLGDVGMLTFIVLVYTPFLLKGFQMGPSPKRWPASSGDYNEASIDCECVGMQTSKS
jgi:hypothetical protein